MTFAAKTKNKNKQKKCENACRQLFDYQLSLKCKIILCSTEEISYKYGTT